MYGCMIVGKIRGRRGRENEKERNRERERGQGEEDRDRHREKKKEKEREREREREITRDIDHCYIQHSTIMITISKQSTKGTIYDVRIPLGQAKYDKHMS